jgi:hypothetical protein
MIAAEEILQEYLIGVQVGNEPDQYALHFHRVWLIILLCFTTG